MYIELKATFEKHVVSSRTRWERLIGHQQRHLDSWLEIVGHLKDQRGSKVESA